MYDEDMYSTEWQMSYCKCLVGSALLEVGKKALVRKQGFS